MENRSRRAVRAILPSSLVTILIGVFVVLNTAPAVWSGEGAGVSVLLMVVALAAIVLGVAGLIAVARGR